MRTGLLLVGLGFCGTLSALSPSECAREVQLDLKRWDFVEMTPALKAHTILARSPVPVVAVGDFDGDKESDAALLIERTDKKRFIAVCLSSSTPQGVSYLEPGCSDRIDSLPKGNGDKDAFMASCYEVTGDTWIYEKGRFSMKPGDGD